MLYVCAPNAYLSEYLPIRINFSARGNPEPAGMSCVSGSRSPLTGCYVIQIRYKLDQRMTPCMHIPESIDLKRYARRNQRYRWLVGTMPIYIATHARHYYIGYETYP